MSREPLVDRKFLEKLERLAIHWQKSFPGLVGGRNSSRFSGAGQEFLDHRHFHHGDDLRAVNWRAYLRLEKLFLKLFQVEPRVPVRVMLDTSLSMATNERGKFDYACRLAAALAYVGLVRLDTILIQPFGAALGEPFRAGGGRHRFAPAVEYLTALEPAGASGFMSVVREFLASYAQSGLLVVISDFLDDAGCEKPLQYLADFGHELLLIQLWDDDDRTPPWDGEIELEDAENARTVVLRFDRAAAGRYTEAFDAHARGVQSLAMRNGGRYVGLATSMPIEEAVFGPLMRISGVA
jgi:uncharacterized protein (DUF58 family)